MNDTPPPAIARRPATIGLVLGVLSAIVAVLWVVAIPLGIVAIVLGWRAAQAAKGRDGRTIGFGIGALVSGTFGILLGLASAAFGGDATKSDTSPPALSWNSSHKSAGCSAEALPKTGGAGLLYCFAAN